MTPTLRRPIVLFGNTRSGTTIVQKVVAEHPDVVAWYEPRTLWLCADPRRRDDEFGEVDARPGVTRYVRRRFVRYQERHGGRRVFEKTPANIFKIPYVRAILPEAHFLFIVRDPFSFLSSVELKWQRPVSGKGIRRRLGTTPPLQLPFYAGRFLSQQFGTRVLRRKYLSTWGPRYRGMQDDLASVDRLTVIARQWALASRKSEEDLARFEAGRVLRLRYEDFVRNPLSDLARICEHCDLELTDGMRRAAREWVKADRTTKWRRFDARELASLVPELEEEMHRHGYVVPPEIAVHAERAVGANRTVVSQGTRGPPERR